MTVLALGVRRTVRLNRSRLSYLGRHIHFVEDDLLAFVQRVQVVPWDLRRTAADSCTADAGGDIKSGCVSLRAGYGPEARDC